MDTKRKSYTPELKLKVVLESMQRDTTQEEVCKKFGITSSMLHRWRKEFQANAESCFYDQRDPKQKAHSQGYEPGESPDDLKKIIGELTVQNEILKKPRGGFGSKDRTKGRTGAPVVLASRPLFEKPGGASAGDRTRNALSQRQTSGER
jgi:transposase-like protein